MSEDDKIVWTCPACRYIGHDTLAPRRTPMMQIAVAVLAGNLLGNLICYWAVPTFKAHREERAWEARARAHCAIDPGPGYELKFYPRAGCLAPKGEWARQLERAGVVGERLYK